eukprot:11228387-Alexandrium_andersonii.AAC.1
MRRQAASHALAMANAGRVSMTQPTIGGCTAALPTCKQQVPECAQQGPRPSRDGHRANCAPTSAP